MGFLHDLFAATADADGEALAIDGGLGKLTYAHLLDRADQIKAQLGGAGAHPGLRIAVTADTLGLDLYPALLAVSALDCALVPFESGGSSGELARLDRLGVWARIGGAEHGTVELSRHTAAEAVRAPESECYVLSTSGSTNAPKDVAISDRNLRSYADYLRAQARVGPGDRISQNYRPQFDAFYEVLVLAAVGRAAMVVPEGRENLLIQRFCTRWDITVWNSVPSQVVMAHRLRQLAPGSLGLVRSAVFGGESLTPQCLSLWREAAPASTVINSYGPSETTIAITEHVMAPGATVDRVEVPIGRVLPHLQWRLIEPVTAPGEVELCVRGPQVFAGYLDPRHNASRFYVEEAGGHRLLADGVPGPDDWYRTGDIVTEGPDGLRFGRRVDHEVKVRGKRVDLAEVETELRGHPGVADARAMVVDDAVHAVVEAMGPDVRDDQIDVSGLRDYARPRTVVWVESLPRLANGKTDLKAIESMLRQGDRKPAEGEADSEGKPLRVAMEDVLLAVLRRKTADSAAVRADRSWAQNGGTSLEAYAALMRIDQELGVVVPVHEILSPRPLGELLDEYADRGAQSPTVVSDVDGDLVPATASQRRHWRHAQSAGSAAFLNIGEAMARTARFDPARAETALRALVGRHESLRNRYVLAPTGELLLDQVADWPSRVEFVHHDEVATAADADALIRAAIGQAFALDVAPPVRGGCVPLPDGTGISYFVVHHIAADGWSADLLRRDFLALYEGQDTDLPDATPFSHYAGTLAARTRAGQYADDIAYWREKFTKVSPEFSIARREGDAVGQRAASVRLSWDAPGEADAVRAAARELGVTTYSLMLAGLLVGAHVMSGEDDVVVMSGVANRNRAVYQETVGLFTNQIFFVGDFRESAAPAADYVRRVHDDVVTSLGRSELPIEVVLDEIGAYASRTLAPYANILFQAADAPIEPRAIQDGTWRNHPLGTGTIKRHCNIHLVDTGTVLALDLDYSVAVVGEKDANRLLTAIRVGVEHLRQAADASVADLAETVRRAVGDCADAVTVFTVDYPGARAEPALAAFIRESFPDTRAVELPVPRSVAAGEIEDCLRRGVDAVARVKGPKVVLAYCSASAWARYLRQSLPEDVVLVCVSGNTLTEADWAEEFADIARRFHPEADLSALAPRIPRVGDLAGRCAAAVDVVATMRSLLESAMRQRFGDTLGRVAKETIEVQLAWMAYLGTCVVLDSLTDADSAQVDLVGNLAEGAGDLADLLRDLVTVPEPEGSR
ncbi:condensation domain-containing protein [Actinokineospora xionganensis]|uniref:AMP-binding protein n=1 Tax=Actinokineospora xionganensis TaxID=2684470 RepID=A0ABR7L412_9PSEU|nr:condensation domain-containing protein [Actinokineospora xionganensis]MBC6447420.1 AMP-binding protein [Actinokineospora xionganensis]